MALLSGAGAVLIGLLMIGGASASAASAALTIKPAYHGLVLPENGIGENGCGSKAALTKHWKFSMKTGLGSGDQVGKAGNCGKHAIKGFSTSSDASANGGFEAAIKIGKIGATITNVSLNLGGKYTVSTTMSDGGSAACSAGVSTYSGDFTEYEWGAVFTGYYYYFSYYNYSDNYDDNGYYYNYSYGNAAVPSPFNLNNTTYYYHDAYYEQFGYCSAEVDTDWGLNGQLFDVHSGGYMYPSGENTWEYGFGYMSLENETDWGWDNYSYWDGPYNSSYSYPTTFYTYNTTLTEYWDSEEYSEYPTFTYTYSYGSNTTPGNTVTNTSTTTLSGESIWFNGPFSATDSYVAVLSFYLDTYAYNENWAHGSASFVGNAATAGNGIKLASITES